MSKAKTVSVDASNEEVRQVEAVELLFNVANIGSKGCLLYTSRCV